ncbi:rnp domain containing protein [Grosmannia clavigera kw1407]|uniref:Rnp domain containing protein n=1 Tax=Grosmannia clavigera (strain kw1407 / UAMH 11150) TaxID=655863 RepID=F0XDA5_GROCL|nr:rnp domain containing protein [Grosmannia clavigera kw1407]EFX04041.1 rnp domain containing protein [Grosmannia clavigera kw1407]
MSSFGPPGVSSPHPSLPPRPPPSTVAASAPEYSSTVSAPPSSAVPIATTYGPSAPPPPSSSSSYYGPATGPQQPQQPQQLQGQARLGYSRTYAPPVGGDRGRGGYGGYNAYPQQQQQPSYGPQTGPTTYGAQYGPTAAATSAAPHIRNPFPTPSVQQQQPHSGGYEQDPQMAAQIANWQGAYMPKENSSYGAGAASGYGSYYGASAASQSQYAGAATSYGPDGSAVAAAAAAAVAGASTTAGTAEADVGGGSGNQERQKTVYRSGGGKTWADDTLLEWDPSHLRLFVGNLAGEVTDETLLKAFSRWKSVQKAVVKRDKWTKKSRGYGFVSFSDADDFFQAAKEMNGKYIGSHPVVVRKSKTEIKVAAVKEDNKKGGKKGRGNGNGNDKNKKKSAGSGGDSGRRDPYEAALGPVASGVHKPGQKTKGGLKLLG